MRQRQSGVRILEPALAGRLRELVQAGSLYGVAQQLGVTREVVARAVSGLPLRHGSYRLVVDALEAHDPVLAERATRERVVAWARTTSGLTPTARSAVLRACGVDTVRAVAVPPSATGGKP